MVGRRQEVAVSRSPLAQSSVTVALGRPTVVGSAGARVAASPEHVIDRTGSDDESLIVEASVVRADLLNEDPTFVTRIVAATFDQPFHSLGRVRSLRDLRRVYRVV